MARNDLVCPKCRELGFWSKAIHAGTSMVKCCECGEWSDPSSWHTREYLKLDGEYQRGRAEGRREGMEEAARIARKRGATMGSLQCQYAADDIFAAIPTTETAPVDTTLADLSMLVKVLARKVSKSLPNDELPAEAMDYLKRKGLQGSPFRAETAPPPEVAQTVKATLIPGMDFRNAPPLEVERCEFDRTFYCVALCDKHGCGKPPEVVYEGNPDLAVISRMQSMCEESLCPDHFGMWETIKAALFYVRNSLNVE